MLCNLPKAAMFITSAFLASGIGYAQDACQTLTGTTVLTVELQNAPQSMEPKDEPTRIRVDDRAHVILCLKNISPLDICSLTNQVATPNTEVNPLESIVQTITGLGGFALSTKSPDLAPLGLTLQEEAFKIAASSALPDKNNPILNDAKYKKFNDAATQLKTSASSIVDQQKAKQASLDDDPNQLATYLAADYRGTRWQLFHPKDDVVLRAVRSDFQEPLSTITSVALTQQLLDTMGSLATDLHKTYDPPATSEIAATLSRMDETLTKSKAAVSVIADNNSALKTGQASVKTIYLAVVKVYDDFVRRLNKLRKSDGDAFLIQDFPLGTNRKVSATGTLSCVSDADAKPTTDPIPYTILYQNVPLLSASTGMLVTFQQKRVIGTTTVAANTAAGFNTIFAVTDSARAQVLPIAYFNVRFLPYLKTHWLLRKEDELDITTNISGGLGLNPNSGTPQPEFFAGLAFGFNKLMIHPGIHFGRVQSLGNGFALNSTVPAGFSGNVPIQWSYRPAFSIGFSVRVAPY